MGQIGITTTVNLQLSERCRRTDTLFRWLLPLLRKMIGSNPQIGTPPCLDPDRLRYNLLDFCYANVCHKLGSSRWSSPLMHFLARRGICSKEVRFREGPDFSQTLAAFAYGSRLLVYFRLSQVAYNPDDPSSSLYSTLQGVHREYLHDRADTPMGEILSLLAYALAIAKSTTSRSTIVWGSSQNANTLYYKGEPVSKEGLRLLVQSMLRKAIHLLTHDLLFDPEFDVFTQDLSVLKDDMTSRTTGHSFLVDPRNITGLRPDQHMVLRRILKQDGVGTHLYTMGDGPNICWLRSGIDGYLFHVQEFLALLAVLVNVTGGQPARGTELLTLRFANSATNVRNIFIQDSEVIIIADYYKNRNQLQKSCPKPRFLPPVVAQLVAVYLIRVLPFVQFLYHKKLATPPDCFKTFLFVSLTEDKPLETNTLTNTLQRETLPTLGWGVGTAAWRQIAISWNRRIRLEGNTDVVEEGLGDSELEGEHDEYEDLNDIQAGHTGHVSKLHYGVRADILHDLTPELMAQYQKISEQWHSFLGVAGIGKGKGFHQGLYIMSSRSER